MTYGACRSAGALGHSSERPARNQADAGHQAEPTHQRQPHLPQQAGDADVEHFPTPPRSRYTPETNSAAGCGGPKGEAPANSMNRLRRMRMEPATTAPAGRREPAP